MISDHDADLAESAQRCLMAALDHSRASKITLVDDSGAAGPVLELPPRALRLLADVLGMMAQRRPIRVVPQERELTTQEAAALLNVSRPFVIKEIEAGRLKCRKVGRHRRIEFEELRRYQARQREAADKALKDLAELSQDLGLGY